jgi:hypothetical protein
LKLLLALRVEMAEAPYTTATTLEVPFANLPANAMGAGIGQMEVVATRGSQ